MCERKIATVLSSLGTTKDPYLTVLGSYEVLHLYSTALRLHGEAQKTRQYAYSKGCDLCLESYVCVGMKLGVLELRVVITNLVHRYALSLAVPNNGDHALGFTLLTNHPLLVDVQHAGSADTARGASRNGSLK
jgi:hypothetical protein